jgi:hypothetical protein
LDIILHLYVSSIIVNFKDYTKNYLKMCFLIWF